MAAGGHFGCSKITFDCISGHFRSIWKLPKSPGGYSGYILVGVCPGTPKKGGLRCGHSPKRGVLGAGTAPKKGGLRCGHNQKKGGLRHVYNPKKGEFRTDLVRSCSKGGLGSLFMYYLYFYLTIWSTSGGVFWQAEKGGS